MVPSAIPAQGRSTFEFHTSQDEKNYKLYLQVPNKDPYCWKHPRDMVKCSGELDKPENEE